MTFDNSGGVRVGAVVLAAGEGRRMGGVTKCLIRLDGVPLITRLLIALSGADVVQVVVVTGSAHRAIEQQVRHASVTLVHNERYTDGHQSSVRVGLAALSGNFGAILIALADQPLVASHHLLELINAFKQRPNGHVLMPVVKSQRGNPIVIDDTVRREILASGTLTCRQFIDEHPELVTRHETQNDCFVTDLDTFYDLTQVALRSGFRLELPAEKPT